MMNVRKKFIEEMTGEAGASFPEEKGRKSQRKCLPI